MVPHLVNISEAASLGLHTMAIMARQPKARFTTQQMAGRLKASSHHLAKVMQRLVKAGLVDSTRGPQGGFRLVRPAGTIKLLEIYEAVEGSVGEAGCLLSEPICDGRDCVLGEVMQSVHRQIRQHLAKTTLATLARGSALGRKSDEAGGVAIANIE